MDNNNNNNNNNSMDQSSSNIVSSISNLDALFPNNNNRPKINDRNNSLNIDSQQGSQPSPPIQNNTNNKLKIDQPRPGSRQNLVKTFHRQNSITHREKQAAKRDRELAKLSKPNRCFRFFVKYPWVVILIVSLLCLLSVGVIAGYDLFKPLGGTGTMFFVFHDDKVAKFQEMVLAREQSRTSLYGENPDPNTGILRDFQTILIYVSDNDRKSLMEPQTLSKIIEFQNSLRQDSQFIKFCPTKSETQPCDFEQSLMFSSFFQTIDFAQPEPVLKATVDQIKNNDPTSTMRLLFHKNVADSTNISNQNVQSIRSLLKFAGPVQGFDNVRDNLEEQIKVFLVFLKHILEKAKLYQQDFTILINNEHFVNDQILSAVTRDLIWIVLSFVLVLLYNTFHMKSLFLGVSGMVQTMVGFPFTYLIYKFVFFIDEFFHLQFIAFFLILGIAADDFFVFYDQWIQSSKLQIVRKQKDKETRLLIRFTITWKHSSWSMLVTSLTSALAFYVIVYSTVIPLKSLGIFTGTLILINYALSITTFPALVLINEKMTLWAKCKKRCKNSRSCSCCRKKKRSKSNSNIGIPESSNAIQFNHKSKIVPQQSIFQQNNEVAFNFQREDFMSNVKNFESPNPLSSITTKFQMSPPINGPATANKINLLSTYKPPKKSRQMQQSAIKYSSDDDIRSCKLKFQNEQMNQRLFSQEDYTLQVQVDKLGCIEKFFYAKFNSCVRYWRVPIIVIGFLWLGFAIYLSYLMTPIKEMEIWLSQDHRVSLAIDQILNNFPPTRGDSVLLGTLNWGVDKVDRSNIGMFQVTKDPDLVWDNNFKLSSPQEQQFFLEISIQLRNFAGPNNYFMTEITQPRNGLNIYNFMEGFSQYVQSRGLYFPVPQTDYYKLMKEFSQSQASKIYRAEPNYGFSTDSNPKQIYAEIQVVTSIKNDTPFEQLNNSIDKWKEICADFNRQAIQRNIPGLSNCHFNGGQPAAWKSTQQVLFIDSAIGMIMVVIISFIVMILTNRNIIIALMALIGVALIVISDIATMKLNNWTFGIAQSLSSVIFVGFSVDYVLHLSNYYINALSPSREYRMQEAYGSIGGSIIGGAITTLVSAMSLLSAQFQLYYKFAFLISSTIIFSLLSSLFFFGALAHSCGPNKSFGDIIAIFRYIFCCKCRKKLPGSPGIGGFRVELRRVKPDLGNLDSFMDYQPEQHSNADYQPTQKKMRNDSLAGLNSDLDQINAGRLWNQINRMEEQNEEVSLHQQKKNIILSKNKTTR